MEWVVAERPGDDLQATTTGNCYVARLTVDLGRGSAHQVVTSRCRDGLWQGDLRFDLVDGQRELAGQIEAAAQLRDMALNPALRRHAEILKRTEAWQLFETFGAFAQASPELLVPPASPAR